MRSASSVCSTATASAGSFRDRSLIARIDRSPFIVGDQPRATGAFVRPPRYNRAVRFVIAMLAALVPACGSPAGPQHPAPPVASKPAAQPPGRAPGPTVAAVVPTIGCPAPTCSFHAGAGGYFTCLSGGAGMCFHFGSPCTPADACMFDPGDRSYKQCSVASEGVCQQWGAACAPATACVFNPADGLHHQCDEVADGGCKRYGALCAP